MMAIERSQTMRFPSCSKAFTFSTTSPWIFTIATGIDQLPCWTIKWSNGYFSDQTSTCKHLTFATPELGRAEWQSVVSYILILVLFIAAYTKVQKCTIRRCRRRGWNGMAMCSEQKKTTHRGEHWRWKWREREARGDWGEDGRTALRKTWQRRDWKRRTPLSAYTGCPWPSAATLLEVG